MISIIGEEDEILFTESDARNKKPGIYILQGDKLTKIGTFTDAATARLFRKVFSGIYNNDGVVKIRY